MTIRVPKSVAVAIAAAVLVGGGLILGLSLRQGTAANGPRVAKLPCTRAAAQHAVLGSKFSDDVFRLGAASLPEELFSTYSLQLIGCRDLTGDGRPEMIVQLACCTAGAFFPWAVFTPHGSRWQLAADRLDTPEAHLQLTADGVEETTPAWSPSDPMCCPGGKREGLLTYQDGHFLYRSKIGTEDRTVVAKVVSDVNAISLLEGSIAGFDLSKGSLVQADEQFGAPTSIAEEEGICTARWRDIGLRMGFYNLTGKSNCGRESRVSTATFDGHEAEQAGWRIDGMQIGMPVAEVQQHYPGIRTPGMHLRDSLTNEGELEGTPFILAERPAYGGRLPVLIARATYGTVIGFDLDVGAAGE